ncbi:hypothetical protein CPC08DRAFT_349306 [Agrocybe pediades]|nr:hypothetical protein CPC08DRAFT_349306 [Agrocybe pediades]
MKLFSRSKSSKSTKASASSPVDITHASTTGEFPSESSRSHSTKAVAYKFLTSTTFSLLRVLKGKRGEKQANRVDDNDQVDASSLEDEQIYSATNVSAPAERRNTTTNLPSPSQTAYCEAPPVVSILIEKAMQAKLFVVAKGKETWDFQTTLAFRTDIVVFSAHTSSVLPLSSPPSGPATASSSVPALVQPPSGPAVPQQHDDQTSGLVDQLAALKMENGSSSSNPAQEEKVSELDQILKDLESMGLRTAKPTSSASGPDTAKAARAKSSQSTNVGHAPRVDEIADGLQSMGIGASEQGSSVQAQPKGQTDAAPPTNVDEEADARQETTEHAQDRENRGSPQPKRMTRSSSILDFRPRISVLPIHRTLR